VLATQVARQGQLPHASAREKPDSPQDFNHEGIVPD
jgi:hypothetical protein